MHNGAWNPSFLIFLSRSSRYLDTIGIKTAFTTAVLVLSYSLYSGAKSEEREMKTSGRCLFRISPISISWRLFIYEKRRATATDCTSSLSSCLANVSTCSLLSGVKTWPSGPIRSSTSNRNLLGMSIGGFFMKRL